MRRSWTAACLTLLLAAAFPASAANIIPVGGQPVDLGINPVTNQIFIRHGGAFANTLTRLDVATLATQAVLFPTAVAAARIDPLRNRVYFQSGASLVIVDGETLASQSFPVPGSLIGLDAGANRFYFLDGLAVHVLDGDTLADLGSASFTGLSASLWGGLAVDPLRHSVQGVVRIYDPDCCWVFTVQEIGGDPPAVIDSMSFGSGFYSWGLAIDPLRRRSYALEAYTPSFRKIEWSTHQVVSGGVSYSTSGMLVDLGGERIWTVKGGDFALEPGVITRFNGNTLAYELSVGMNSEAVTLNPASRRLYAIQVFEQAPRSVRAIDLDTGAAVTLPGSDSNNGGPLRVNPATNRIYGPYFPGANLVEYDEPVATPVPMPTSITPGVPQPNGSIAVDFAATSGWTVPHPVRQIYYQLDSIRGTWLPASPAGATAQASLTGLAPGEHTLYALATDGQESLSPTLTGPIQSVAINIPAPSACSNGIDDDGDGLVDYPADPGCMNASGARENPACDNDADDDGDGAIDWDGGAAHAAPDPQCANAPWRNTERASSCGLGAELAFVIAVLRGVRRKRS